MVFALAQYARDEDMIEKRVLNKHTQHIWHLNGKSNNQIDWVFSYPTNVRSKHIRSI